MKYFKLQYSVYYFPGAGGVVVNWLIGLANDHTLLPIALSSFPKSLKSQPKTVRENGKPISGWTSHEVPHKCNPFSRSIAIHDGTNPKSILSLIKISNTTNILVDTPENIRLRLCYEKRVMPFNVDCSLTKADIKFRRNEVKLFYRNLQNLQGIDYIFKYATIFNNTYVDEIEAILNRQLLPEQLNAINTLVNRYIEVTPLKVKNII
jgi:hypothetical protein